MGGGEGRQLYLPESSVPLEQEWVIRDGTAESLVTVLTASLPFSGHPGLLRGKTCPVSKGMSHWSDITLASRIFSSLGGRLPSLEGGETGRKCLWQMELTFSPLASCVSLYSSQNHGLAFPQGTQGLSYAVSSHPHCKEPTCIALLCNQHCCQKHQYFQHVWFCRRWSFGRKVHLSPDGPFLPPLIHRHSWSSEVFRLLGFAVKCQL